MDDELECSIPIGDGDGQCDPPSIPILRGGPIYLSNMSSPITSVSLFQDSLLSQLQVFFFLSFSILSIACNFPSY
jgi:hypothetical protein